MNNWLSIQEFADKLGVHRCSIYARIKKGTIKSRKVGAYNFLPASEVDKWGIVPREHKKSKKLYRKNT